MKVLASEIRTAFIAIFSLAVILCGFYPLTVYVVGNLLFGHEAGGSLLIRNGRVRGSSLIAQGFTSEKYFHPRPSSAGRGFDAAASGGSNLGPTSRKLTDTIRKRVADYHEQNMVPAFTPVPVDAVTASASGLDPHISLKNALLQAPRVAIARNMSEKAVLREIAAHTEGRSLGILGEPRTNVLKLNISLDVMLR